MSRDKQCWACGAKYDMQGSHCPECGVSNSGNPLPVAVPVDLQAMVDATPHAGPIAVQEGSVTPTQAVKAWNALRSLTDAMDPAVGQQIMGLVRTYAQLQYEVGRNDGSLDKVMETPEGFVEQMAEDRNWLRAKLRELQHRSMAPSQEDIEPLRVGNAYRTLGGDVVRIEGFCDEGTPHETTFDQHGIHRYTQPCHQVGRVPESPHDFSDPRNIAPLYARREGPRVAPEEWRFVPIDPTPAMREASGRADDWDEAWRLMLDAAPDVSYAVVNGVPVP